MFSLTFRRPTFRRPARAAGLLALLAIVGPGLVSGFADNDAGGITTYSIAGAQFGYDLLWVLLASQVALFFTQEVGARIGLATGQGLSGLIRERFGIRWATFAVLTLLAANLGDTLAEFAGIGAALSLFGVPVQISAGLAAVAMVLLLARDRRLMGELRSGPVLAAIGWLVTGALAVLSLSLVVSQVVPI